MLKPITADDVMEEKLHGYYIITPDSVYPIKACLSDKTQTHSSFKDIFDACGYHYSTCHCNGDYPDTEPKCGNADHCRRKFRFCTISRFLERILKEHIDVKNSGGSKLQINSICSVKIRSRK